MPFPWLAGTEPPDAQKDPRPPGAVQDVSIPACPGVPSPSTASHQAISQPWNTSAMPGRRTDGRPDDDRADSERAAGDEGPLAIHTTPEAHPP